MNKTLTFALVIALAAGLALADDLEEPAFGSLAGQVKGTSAPLSFSRVYAYHLSDQSLSKVVTDAEGNFRFDALPAGLYKVIAFKDGFVPAIALITRSKREVQQYLNLELAAEKTDSSEQLDGFWAVREKIPSDVLRDLEVDERQRDLLARADVRPRLPSPYVLETSMQAIAGVEQNAELGAAARTVGRVGVEGEIAEFRVGLTGDFVALQGTQPDDLAVEKSSGRSHSVSVRVDNRSSTGVRVSSVNNSMTRPDAVTGSSDYVGLERHQVSWSQDLGSLGRSDFSAEYAEENNFYRRAAIEPYGIPDASRLWRVEGSYSASPTTRSTVKTGFRYRERQSLFEVETRHARESLNFIPSQRVDLFGQGGMQLSPGVLVEIGLYSTMRDGSLSLSPSAGMVIKLGDHWRAQASGSFRAHEEDREDIGLYSDFNTALFGQHDICDSAEEYCYSLNLAHKSAELENMSVGLVHRRYAETLHLYFNEDFFSRLESVYLVEGDDLPEVQLAATRRLAPKVLARLSSNLAAGGGGILYATDKTSYENQVRYLVTSLNTQFEHTSTGVFVAFHHLAQQLNPIEGQSSEAKAPEMELHRLQVMLTQDLDVLSHLASQWAVHLNMELSRGTAPETDPQFDDEELRKRVMGGLTVSF